VRISCDEYTKPKHFTTKQDHVYCAIVHYTCNYSIKLHRPKPSCGKLFVFCLPALVFTKFETPVKDPHVFLYSHNTYATD